MFTQYFITFCFSQYSIIILFFFPFCVLDLIKEVLSLDDEIQKLAAELYQQKSVLIMGRGYHYATCLEGALVSKFNSNQLRLNCCCFFDVSTRKTALFVYTSDEPCISGWVY